jgi:hypothetical protein
MELSRVAAMKLRYPALYAALRVELRPDDEGALLAVEDPAGDARTVGERWGDDRWGRLPRPEPIGVWDFSVAPENSPVGYAWKASILRNGKEIWSRGGFDFQAEASVWAQQFIAHHKRKRDQTAFLTQRLPF